MIPPAAVARCRRTGPAPKLNIVSPSSSTATQCLHAMGCAEAGRYFTKHPEAAAKHDGDYRQFKDVTFHGDEVVYVSIGEGSTSQGEFWESLNTASNGKLPVVYVVEDNGYAISTPVEVNTPGGNISRLVANFPNFHFAEIDGTDPIASYNAMVEAVAYCRAGQRPGAGAWACHSSVLALAQRRRTALSHRGRA